MPGWYSRLADLIWPAIVSGLFQVLALAQAFSGASTQTIVALSTVAICNAVFALRA